MECALSQAKSKALGKTNPAILLQAIDFPASKCFFPVVPFYVFVRDHFADRMHRNKKIFRIASSYIVLKELSNKDSPKISNGESPSAQPEGVGSYS